MNLSGGGVACATQDILAVFGGPPASRRLWRAWRHGAATLAVVAATLVVAVPAHAQNAERVEAVGLARAGDLDGAIARLQELRAQYPQDMPLASDLAVILGWAGRDREVLEVFETIGPDAAFDYTLFAAARSARAVGDLGRAEAYLKRGAERFPDDPRWALLRALVYVDGRRFDEAREILTASYGADPSNLEGLLAWGYLSSQSGDVPGALRYYAEVLKHHPENREALTGRIMVLEALGAPFRAQELAREPANLLNRPERDRIAETESALMLRWGRLAAGDPARRYEATDRAIAVLERHVAELEARPGPPGPALQRARFDLLVAYRDRVRMRDAVAVYEHLRQAGVSVPAYSRLSAAAAYLYLEEPETARDLYQSVVDENPPDPEVRFESRLGLFYAWVPAVGHRLSVRLLDHHGADRGGRDPSRPGPHTRAAGRLGEPRPGAQAYSMTGRDVIIDAPGERSRFLVWRDRALTVLLWGAWSRPVDALARLAAGPTGAEGGQLWSTFLRDLGDASSTAGVLIAVLYAWGGYERVRRTFTRTRSG